MGKSIIQWKSMQNQCTKLFKNPLSIKSLPPPNGCSVLSENREECILYNKFCAWDELQKF